MKKFLTFVASIVFFATSFTAHAFSDVSTHQWVNSITYLQDTGIIQGYPDGSFKPDNKITRAEFTKILMEGFYENITQEYYGKPCFTDLKGDEWWAKYACLAKDEGILKGYEDGSFGGEKLITQPEALKIILNTVGETVPELGSQWYDKYFDYSESLGMYYFDVKNRVGHQMTRAETAYYITWLSSEEWLDQIDDTRFYKDKYRYNIGYHTLDPNECFEGEAYDAEEQMCYLDCSSEQECILRESQAIANLQDLIDDYQGEGENLTGEETTVSIYYIDGNEKTLIEDVPGMTGDHLAIQQDKTKHDEVWEYFIDIIPAKYRKNIVQLEIFSDGYGGTLAAVTPTLEDPTEWILYLDIADSHPNGELEKNELVLTLVHEFAHLITLDEEQVPPIVIADDDLYWENYAEEVEKCAPNYYPGEGCSKDNSYINVFFETFWGDLYEEFTAIEEIEDEEAYYAALDDFYQRYSDQFVTDYAVTNPAEDIAESFMLFVVMEKPEGNTIAEQKIKFFYKYPDLVDMREYIRSRI